VVDAAALPEPVGFPSVIVADAYRMTTIDFLPALEGEVLAVQLR
jgi:hypothetical protein